jgi:hypothetical protein
MYEARALAEHLRQQGYGDDEALLVDSIEGETDALAAVDRILDQIGEAEQTQVVLQLRERELAERRARYDARAISLRSTLLGWMADVGIQKLERPEATVSLTKGRPGVIYTQDLSVDMLDPRFIKTTTAPDKSAIRKAVLEGEVVIGAELSNSPPSLVIRRS